MMKRLMLVGWFFFVMNASGDPMWNPYGFASLDDCNAARTWLLGAHFKTASPDATLSAQYVSPCWKSQSVTVQQ